MGENIGALGDEGRINKMAEGQMRIADSDITYQSSRITKMGDSVGRYTMADEGST